MIHFKAPAASNDKKRIQWIIPVIGVLILFLSVCAQMPPLSARAQQDLTTETPIPLVLEEILQFSTDKPIPQGAASLVARDRLMLLHEDGTLCAYDLTTQTQSWCYDALEDPVLGGVDETTVYLMGVDSATSQVRMVVLDLAAGNPLWQMDIREYNGRQIACEGTLLAGKMICSLGNVILAVDTETPSILWVKDLENQLSVPFSSGGRVFVAAATTFYALDADSGSTLWQMELNADSGVQMVVLNGNVIVTGGDNTITVLDTGDGSVLWSHQGDEKPCRVLSNGDVLLSVSSNGRLKRLDASSGDVIWELPPALEMGDFCPPLVLANGYLYINQIGGRVLGG